MPSTMFLGSSLSLDWILHATLIEGGYYHSRLGFTLTLGVWSMYYGMPVQQQYMEVTARVQKTEVVVGTVRIHQ